MITMISLVINRRGQQSGRKFAHCVARAPRSHDASAPACIHCARPLARARVERIKSHYRAAHAAHARTRTQFPVIIDASLGAFRSIELRGVGPPIRMSAAILAVGGRWSVVGGRWSVVVVADGHKPARFETLSADDVSRKMIRRAAHFQRGCSVGGLLPGGMQSVLHHAPSLFASQDKEREHLTRWG